MMKKLLFSIIGIFAITSTLMAQKLEVKEFKVVTNDPAATQYAVKDYNGHNCALIIVGLAVENVQFEGNIIKQERKPNGEYWVYITDGSLDFQINSNNYLPEEVNFNTFGITAVESGRTYRMFVEHPNLAKSYDELLEIAKDYYRNYPDHMESSYYLAAQKAYENAIDHNDCPPNNRDALQIECNAMKSIRRQTYSVERLDFLASDIAKRKGFENDSVYICLTAEYNHLTKLLEEHAEIKGYKDYENNLLQRIQRHPQSKSIEYRTVYKLRQTIKGNVSFKRMYKARPFASLNVYAIDSPKINFKKGKLIGRVNPDGSFNVIMPDNMNYLFIDAEKEDDKSHYISAEMKEIDIVID